MVNLHDLDLSRMSDRPQDSLAFIVTLGFEIGQILVFFGVPQFHRLKTITTTTIELSHRTWDMLLNVFSRHDGQVTGWIYKKTL